MSIPPDERSEGVRAFAALVGGVGPAIAADEARQATLVGAVMDLRHLIGRRVTELKQSPLTGRADVTAELKGYRDALVALHGALPDGEALAHVKQLADKLRAKIDAAIG
ncbi:MAG: hypothetical protein IT381_31785 [Deltaproteobacteria bacterium]|nr:hypothetical protein [Deltaproteobacteria bacterium]